MRPVIGVMPLWDDKKDSVWMLPGYLDGVTEAGGLPVIFPLTDNEADLKQLIGMCHGFLFTGGQDVSPDLYGEEPLEGLLDTCEQRDAMDLIVLREALKMNRPVLGICRGLQFINVSLGGTLYQDLPTQHPSRVTHRQKAPYHLPAHPVELVSASPLRCCLGEDEILVNSCHHQAVKALASGLMPMAVSPDGLTEALYAPEKAFLWAVQWHPEFSHRTDESSRRIFRAFVEAAENTDI